jgi:hypothetical protein
MAIPGRQSLPGSGKTSVHLDNHVFVALGVESVLHLYKVSPSVTDIRLSARLNR